MEANLAKTTLHEPTTGERTRISRTWCSRILRSSCLRSAKWLNFAPKCFAKFAKYFAAPFHTGHSCMCVYCQAVCSLVEAGLKKEHCHNVSRLTVYRVIFASAYFREWPKLSSEEFFAILFFREPLRRGVVFTPTHAYAHPREPNNAPILALWRL